jgi:hypothetical protein
MEANLQFRLWSFLSEFNKNLQNAHKLKHKRGPSHFMQLPVKILE